MDQNCQGKPDRILIVSIVIQLIIGSAFIYSIINSLYQSELIAPDHYFKQYLMILLFSLIATGIFFRYVSIETIKNTSYWFIGAAIILATTSLILGVGVEINEASGWTKIGSLPVYISPIIVLFLIIGTSKFLADHFDQSQTRSTQSTKVVFALFVLVYLIINQPNLFTFSILATLPILMCFCMKLYKHLLVIVIINFVSLLWFLLFSAWSLKEQMKPFIDPYDHQFGLSDQRVDNLLMIGGGDLTGQGYGQGVIPLAPDGGFVYAAIVEETGFLGAFVIIVCSLFILWRSFRIAQNCLKSNRYFEGLVVIGIASWTALLSLTHIAATTGLIVTVSVHYPFLSYGNAYLIAMIFSYGLVLRIGMTVCASKDKERVNTQLLVNLFAGLFLIVGIYTFHLAVMNRDADHYYQQRVTNLQDQNSDE